jgi:glycosyltransferase involved in cell wall biosynthesis
MIQPDKAEILYVAHDTGLIGGAERQLLELFRGIDRDRFSPHLVCLEEGGPVAAGATELGVPVTHMARKWRWDLGAIFRMKGYIRDHRIAIVHAYLGLPGFYGAMAGKASGIKVITTIRIAGPRRRLADATERLAFMVSDRIISNSRAGVDYYFRRFPGRSKTTVVYNGYEMTDFEPGRQRSRADLGLPEGKILVGHVANLSYLKDYPTFIRALAVVFGEQPDARAVIVGDGDRRGNYEALARSLGIRDRIEFLGHRRDVLDLVSRFDVCVLASHGAYSEGLSNSIAEYMGLGKPVVATAVGGNVELVQDGVTGYLCPAGEPGPMAEKILQLLGSAEAREAMGAEGRKFFEANLTLERMIAETQRVYESLLVR